jgi:hypothetical protein
LFELYSTPIIQISPVLGAINGEVKVELLKNYFVGTILDRLE